MKNIYKFVETMPKHLLIRPIVPKSKLLYLLLDVKLKDMKKTMYLFLNHAQLTV